MSECIRQLCMLSILFGVILDITPEGSVKKVSGIVCSAALITLILSGIKNNTELSDYYMETARYREMSAAITANAQENNERLSRLVIQSECEEYIKDKATVLGMKDIIVKVTARWNSDGFWMPETVTLQAVCSQEEKVRLSDIIETELGIEKGNQTWIG